MNDQLAASMHDLLNASFLLVAAGCIAESSLIVAPGGLAMLVPIIWIKAQ